MQSHLPAIPDGSTRASAGRAPADVTELLNRIWQQNLPVVRERVGILELAAQEALHGTLSGARRQEAHDLAHKLAGSLGMFGYTRGTEIARALEDLLYGAAPVDVADMARLTMQLRSALPL